MPTVILDVTRGQTTTSLDELVFGYVLGGMDIRAIVVLNLYYGPSNSKEAWVNLWVTDAAEGGSLVKICKVMDNVVSVINCFALLSICPKCPELILSHASSFVHLQAIQSQTFS